MLVTEEEGQSLIRFVKSILRASFGPTEVIIPMGIEERISGFYDIEIILYKDGQVRYISKGNTELPLGLSLIHATKQFFSKTKQYDKIKEDELNKIKVEIILKAQEETIKFKEK